jgi:hypothetical protein
MSIHFRVTVSQNVVLICIFTCDWTHKLLMFMLRVKHVIYSQGETFKRLGRNLSILKVLSQLSYSTKRGLVFFFLIYG